MDEMTLDMHAWLCRGLDFAADMYDIKVFPGNFESHETGCAKGAKCPIGMFEGEGTYDLAMSFGFIESGPVALAHIHASHGRDDTPAHASLECLLDTPVLCDKAVPLALRLSEQLVDGRIVAV